METSVSGCLQQPEMSIGVDGLIVALVNNGEAPATEVIGIGLQRSAVQQQTLAMHTHRPAGIRAEEQWILDQRDRSPSRDRRMVSEQLMRENDGDVHLSRTPRLDGRRAVRELWQSPGPPVRLSD